MHKLILTGEITLNVNDLCPFSSPVEEKKKLKFCFFVNNCVSKKLLLSLFFFFFFLNSLDLAFECICKHHFCEYSNTQDVDHFLMFLICFKSF